MYTALEEIARIKREQDPEDAHIYTVDWARDFCAYIGKSPDEYLQWYKAETARLESLDYEAMDKKAEELAKENPEYYAKMTGPVDGFSYGLMLKSGEIKEVLSGSDTSDQ